MPDMERATDRVDRASATAASEPWWRSAVIYQVYIRSFADSNGDGVGDIAGLRSRLDYLADLGVDAIWINPWYPSPMKDAGYDVSDYRDIEPVFGTLDEADELIQEADDCGLRVLLVIVPNHTSDQHPWFQQALAAPAGSPERDRLLFRDGRGPGGNELETNPLTTGSASSGARRGAGCPGRSGRSGNPRAVVRAPVHARAAGPELGQRRRQGRFRAHPAVLVRPRN